MTLLIDIVVIIETILLIALFFGSYYGRKLNMTLHHRLIYSVVAVQLVLFFAIMAPAVSFWREETGIGVILGLHMVMGIITLTSSVILCVVFLMRGNDFDLPLLRWTKPLMIFTFISWVITFTLGIIFYINTYILGDFA